MEFLIKSMFVVPLLAVVTIWNGYVLSVLWGWFLVPALSLPPIRIPYAIGISIVVGMLTHQYGKSEHEMSEVIIVGLTTPAVFLLFGWIVKFFA